ncbi:MAG: polyphosphate kinase 1 [Pirellulaceae bacterium]|nr:polyphosphate kinase 1 [Pirellulaceae bacterium]
MNFPQTAFVNRELSWLEFDQRVLDQAMYDLVPLLERLKFLAITASNLDEFFMVRVGGLRVQRERQPDLTDPTGKTPAEQLAAIYDRIDQMIHGQYKCFLEQIEPNLKSEGFERITLSSASAMHQAAARRVFDEEIFPVISPIAVDPSAPFPLLVNLGLYLCVHLAARAPTESEEEEMLEQEEHCRAPHFAFIPLGKAISRFVTLPSEKGFAYALLDDVVAEFVEQFFPSDTVLECKPFRITRNSDINLQEDNASDLMEGMERVLHERRTANSVRLDIAENASDSIIDFLREALQLEPRDVFLIPGPIDLSSMMSLTGMQGFAALRDSAWPPQESPLIEPSKSMFETIAERDFILCHPYESFEPVVRFIEEAANDPDVLAIKQVLYRTSRKSPIVAALKLAADRGKYVTAIVELKARFDEARNIEWARELEEAGVHVIYGIRGLKTHAKICIIVRREPQGIQRYCHFGTGNYNEATARMYSDISYFTCNEELGADATSFMNAITAFSQPQSYRRIEAAPIGLRKRLLGLIESETQRKKQGQKAYIAAKLNSLVDPEMIGALYRASQAGVQIKLNIRGICCLRAGVPGLSENITVVSIIDRFLEHARVLYFYHGGDEKVFLSSADWMPRNLDRRIELLVPIEDLASRRRLLEVLDTYFRDNQNAWRLNSDGTYERIQPTSTQAKVRAQRVLYQAAVDAVQSAEQARRNTFQPHEAAKTS